MISSSTLSDRKGLWAFILGVACVTAGVGLHIPMFLMGRAMHYQLYGMPMGNDMIAGMGLIIGGVAALLAGERRRAHDPVTGSPPSACRRH